MSLGMSADQVMDADGDGLLSLNDFKAWQLVHLHRMRIAVTIVR